MKVGADWERQCCGNVKQKASYWETWNVCCGVGIFLKWSTGNTSNHEGAPESSIVYYSIIEFPAEGVRMYGFALKGTPLITSRCRKAWDLPQDNLNAYVTDLFHYIMINGRSTWVTGRSLLVRIFFPDAIWLEEVQTSLALSMNWRLKIIANAISVGWINISRWDYLLTIEVTVVDYMIWLM